MATGDTYSNNGAKLLVAVGRPATENQTGYGALTWVQVDGIVTIPEMGDESEDISESTLADGRNTHQYGVKDGGAYSLNIKHIDGDAGRELLEAQSLNNATVSFQRVYNSGKALFSFGLVGPVKQREASGSNFEGVTASIVVNSGTFKGTEE